MERTTVCTARQVANAGIVLSCKGISVGIDVFSKDENGIYPDTPEELKENLFQEIRKGQLKWLLITHEHSDHFERAAVVKAWECNQELQILSTETVVRQLMSAGIPVENLHIADGKTLQLDGNGVRVISIYSQHEGKAFAQVEHLTFLFKVNGSSFVVSGDAKPLPHLFQKIGQWSRKIDCFFLPFPYAGRPSVRRMIETELEIARLWVFHCPKPSFDQQNWMEKSKKICREAGDGLPEPYFGWPDGKVLPVEGEKAGSEDKWR